MPKRTFIFKEVSYEHYRVFDDMNFPYGEVYKKGFVLVVSINFPMDYDELQTLLSSIREKDIGQFTKYAIQMEF